MGWKSTGKDAPRKGDSPFEFGPRKQEKKQYKIFFDPHFMDHIKKVAKQRQVPVSTLIRYVLAVETDYKGRTEEEE